ncbi:uncharacterized protein LOC111301067 [Durio zibethinus]|uniref:Uncharacterized protein LOC111301067 n=1 Tax=Durio zibethinus TaxID=66656 RepID=A0A6P5ZHU7_DURZI|nr:uncharacterized protein LOC111301067 [Durio zibethinus]
MKLILIKPNSTSIGSCLVILISAALKSLQVVENEKEPPQLPANPTVTQMKNYSEEKAKRYKAKSCIESSVFDDIFIRIMTCETAKQAWDVLMEELQGSDKTRQMQVLNLRREFEVLKMKESENLKQYNDRLMKIVNKIRLLGEELSDKKIVEKVLVSLPERYCKQLGHIEKVCKNKKQQQPDQQARVADKQQQLEEQVFVVTCYGTRTSLSAWFIDSGCTYHMASDINMFKELDKTCTSKVRIGNGDFIEVKKKRVVTVETPTGTKLISDVLFVPKIDQNQLSVGQLLENNYSLVFKDKACTIHDPTGHKLFTVNMKGICFSLN